MMPQLALLWSYYTSALAISLRSLLPPSKKTQTLSFDPPLYSHTWTETTFVSTRTNQAPLIHRK